MSHATFFGRSLRDEREKHALIQTIDRLLRVCYGWSPDGLVKALWRFNNRATLESRLEKVVRDAEDFYEMQEILGATLDLREQRTGLHWSDPDAQRREQREIVQSIDLVLRVRFGATPARVIKALRRIDDLDALDSRLQSAVRAPDLAAFEANGCCKIARPDVAKSHTSRGPIAADSTTVEATGSCGDTPGGMRFALTRHMRSDTEFNRLARDDPEALILLLTGRRPHGSFVSHSPVLKRTERRADIVLEPADPGDDWWLIECVGYADEQILRAVAEKAVLLAQEKNLWGRLRTAVIFTKGCYARDLLPASLHADSAPLVAPEQVVLDQWTPARLLAAGPELFPLVPFSNIGRPELKRGLRKWWRRTTAAFKERPETPKKLRDLFVSFYAARYPHDDLTEIQRALEVVAMDIRETRLGQDLIEIGEKRALLGAIDRVLRVRFGETPDEILQTLQQVEDQAVLASLLETAVQAHDLPEFRRHLG